MDCELMYKLRLCIWNGSGEWMGLCFMGMVVKSMGMGWGCSHIYGMRRFGADFHYCITV